MIKERVAVLDLGTNTFHLLIADPGDERPVIIYHETIAVKLGEGGISKGQISGDAFLRGLNALKNFKKKIDHYQVTKIKSAATSALRSASNGNDFLARVKSETGLVLEVIDGDREAALIYLGVKAAIDMTDTTLIVDIGGGSVEFILGDNNTVLWKKSYPIGAARLMDKFHHSDPISGNEKSQLLAYLEEVLDDLKQQILKYQPAVMVGSAGSFETFAELEDPLFKPSFEVPGRDINIEKFREISANLIQSTHEVREAMDNIPKVRVDMIVVSAILTNYILDLRDFQSLKLSTYSLKEGILFEYFK